MESSSPMPTQPCEPERRPERQGSWRRDVVVGVAAGLVAMAVTGAADRLLDRFVSREQKIRDRLLRPGRPHEIAGPRFGEKLLQRGLSPGDRRAADTAFNLAYGIGWGIVYTLSRRMVPQASRFGGLPFAVPFFVLCDAVIAPLLRLTPTAEKVPWQMNMKELGNHVAWTVGAEATHRVADRFAQ